MEGLKTIKVPHYAKFTPLTLIYAYGLRMNSWKCFTPLENTCTVQTWWKVLAGLNLPKSTRLRDFQSVEILLKKNKQKNTAG